MSLYGFHEEDSLFAKVTLVNPEQLRRVAQVVQSGTVLGCSFQPYESHVPFLLQVFADYNIAGMGWLHLSECTVRSAKRAARSEQRGRPHACVRASLARAASFAPPSPSARAASGQRTAATRRCRPDAWPQAWHAGARGKARTRCSALTAHACHPVASKWTPQVRCGAWRSGARPTLTTDTGCNMQCMTC